MPVPEPEISNEDSNIENPFSELKCELEIRRLYKNLARRMHPDANPLDARAPERFRLLTGQYRRALARMRNVEADAESLEAPRPVPKTPLACPVCGDGFTIGHTCPRCNVALFDRHLGAPELEDDPAVLAMIADLEERAKKAEEEPLFVIPERARPPLMASGMFGFAWGHWEIGLIGSSILFFGFGSLVMLLLAHEQLQRIRPPEWFRMSQRP